MGGNSSARMVSSGRHRHTMPLHSRIISAMPSTVSFSAAKIRSASFSRSSSSSRATARPSRKACKAAAIRGGMSTRSSWARSAVAEAGEGKLEITLVMSETLSQKIGRKTFQGIANRQNDALAPPVFIDGNGFRPTQLRRRNARNGHDYLHIFFHPDYDRRL